MLANAVVPKTAPAWVPENFSVTVRYVLRVTYHDPQITRLRNIIRHRRALREMGIGAV
jgi:hypothetical protein